MSVKKAVKTLSSAKGCGLVISERDGRTHIRLVGETGRALKIIQMALTENPFLNAMAQHVVGPKIRLSQHGTESDEEVVGGIVGVEEGGEHDSAITEQCEDTPGGNPGGDTSDTTTD